MSSYAAWSPGCGDGVGNIEGKGPTESSRVTGGAGGWRARDGRRPPATARRAPPGHGADRARAALAQRHASLQPHEGQPHPRCGPGSAGWKRHRRSRRPLVLRQVVQRATGSFSGRWMIWIRIDTYLLRNCIFVWMKHRRCLCSSYKEVLSLLHW